MKEDLAFLLKHASLIELDYIESLSIIKDGSNASLLITISGSDAICKIQNLKWGYEYQVLPRLTDKLLQQLVENKLKTLFGIPSVIHENDDANTAFKKLDRFKSACEYIYNLGYLNPNSAELNEILHEKKERRDEIFKHINQIYAEKKEVMDKYQMIRNEKTRNPNSYDYPY